MCAVSLQPCPTPCDLMDCSPPSSSIHGIIQARTLQWVAMPFSRGSFRITGIIYIKHTKLNTLCKLVLVVPP